EVQHETRECDWSHATCPWSQHMEARPTRRRSRHSTRDKISRVAAGNDHPEGEESKRPQRRGPVQRPVHATSVAVGLGMIALPRAAGSFTRNHATYNAGRKISVRIVATSNPPMTAMAIGPQNIVTAIGISPRTVEIAVSMI